VGRAVIISNMWPKIHLLAVYFCTFVLSCLDSVGTEETTCVGNVVKCIYVVSVLIHCRKKCTHAVFNSCCKLQLISVIFFAH